MTDIYFSSSFLFSFSGVCHKLGIFYLVFRIRSKIVLISCLCEEFPEPSARYLLTLDKLAGTTLENCYHWNTAEGQSWELKYFPWQSNESLSWRSQTNDYWLMITVIGPGLYFRCRLYNILIYILSSQRIFPFIKIKLAGLMFSTYMLYHNLAFHSYWWLQ